MKNYLRPGDTITHAHSVPVASGQLVAIGGLLAVAASSYAANEPGEYAIEGVYVLPKATGAAVGQGNTLNLNLSSGELTEALPESAILGGAIAMESSDSAATTVVVKLVPGTGAAGGSGV